MPGGGDVYLLSGVLLDWNDQRGAQILQGCQKAMAETADLLLIDAVLPEHPRSSLKHLLDLHMMLTNSGGRLRSQPEWEQLPANTGFHLDAVIPIGLFGVLHASPTSR